MELPDAGPAELGTMFLASTVSAQFFGGCFVNCLHAGWLVLGAFDAGAFRGDRRTREGRDPPAVFIEVTEGPLFISKTKQFTTIK